MANCHICKAPVTVGFVVCKACAKAGAGTVEPEKPLTLEQLQKMDGEPVYVIDLECPKESGWCIVGRYYDGTIALFRPDNIYYVYAIKTRAALAYKSKPTD